MVTLSVHLVPFPGSAPRRFSTADRRVIRKLRLLSPDPRVRTYNSRDETSFNVIGEAAPNQKPIRAVEGRWVSKHRVILIHGIRTEAGWAEMVRRVLEASPEIYRTHILRYGYFDLFRFITPGPWRNRPAVALLALYDDLRLKEPSGQISILAHSFGTYTVARALEQRPTLRLYRLALCGSIISRSFNWSRIRSQVTQQIVNDCGTQDVWPVLAQVCSKSYGATGVFGIGGDIDDRFHQLGHSEFFSRHFAERFWAPFFSVGIVHRPENELDEPRTSKAILSILALFRVRYVLVALVCIAVIFLAQPRPPKATFDRFLQSQSMSLVTTTLPTDEVERANHIAETNQRVAAMDRLFRGQFARLQGLTRSSQWADYTAASARSMTGQDRAVFRRNAEAIFQTLIQMKQLVGSHSAEVVAEVEVLERRISDDLGVYDVGVGRRGIPTPPTWAAARSILANISATVDLSCEQFFFTCVDTTSGRRPQ